MSFPQRTKLASSWLDAFLCRQVFHEVWLFGSFTTARRYPRDADVLGIYRQGQMETARRVGACARVQFQREFGLPLHLVLLSASEVHQVKQHVENMLISGFKVR